MNTRRKARLWAWSAALFVLLTCVTASAQESAPDKLIEGFSIFLPHGGDYPDAWAEMPDRVARIRSPFLSDVLTGGEIHVLPDLNLYFREREQPELAPRWAQGLAIPGRQLILLKIPDEQFLRTLTHELSHLAVHEAAGGNHMPHWFLEGYAIYQAEEWDAERAMSLSQAALFGNTLDFEDLDGSFPPHWQTAGLAYAQSFHFVKRLMDTYGEDKIGEWLLAVSQGTPWQEAFRATYGVPVGREFKRWSKTVRVWYAWVPAVVSATTLWSLLAVLVLWIRRRLRLRRQGRLAAMAAHESELYGPDPDDDLFA